VKNPSSNLIQIAFCGIQEAACDSVDDFEACYGITFQNIRRTIDCWLFQRMNSGSQFSLSCRQSCFKKNYSFRDTAFLNCRGFLF
jgi:hypothetical protein